MQGEQEDKGDDHARSTKQQRNQALLAHTDMVIGVAPAAHAPQHKEGGSNGDAQSSHDPPEQSMQQIWGRYQCDPEKSWQCDDQRIEEFGKNLGQPLAYDYAWKCRLLFFSHDRFH